MPKLTSFYSQKIDQNDQYDLTILAIIDLA